MPDTDTTKTTCLFLSEHGALHVDLDEAPDRLVLTNVRRILDTAGNIRVTRPIMSYVKRGEFEGLAVYEVTTTVSSDRKTWRKL